MKVLESILHSDELLWLQECPIPCDQTVYHSKLIQYHINNLVGHDEEFVNQVQKHGAMLGISFETFAIHEQVETLVIDIGNFLSQIGGNLGLFLGVSCLSLLTGIIQFSWQAVRRWISE